MLGHRDGRDARRVGHDDSVVSRSAQVDMVGPRAPKRKHPQLRTSPKDVGAKADRGADIDDGLRVADTLEQDPG